MGCLGADVPGGEQEAEVVGFDAGDFFVGVDTAGLVETAGHPVVIVEEVVFDDEVVDV